MTVYPVVMFRVILFVSVVVVTVGDISVYCCVPARKREAERMRLGLHYSFGDA